MPGQGFGNWKKDTVRFKCNDKKLRGFFLTYKSSDGYRGADQFDILVLYPNGYGWEAHFNMNVR